MGLKCRIQKSGNTTKVYNKNGTESKLYKDALALTGKEKKALNIWAISTLPVFEEAFGFRNENDEVDLDMVLKFYRERRVTSDKLSPREMYEVRHFMKNNGIASLSELVQKMKPIFVKNGKVQLDTKLGVQSGLFLQEDFENSDVSAVNDLLAKLEGQLLSGGFQVDLEQKDVQYRNPENKTIFGSSEAVSQTELEQELMRNVQDFSNKTEFDSAVAQLPYYEFIEKYQSDQEFAKKFYGYFSDLKKIPVSQIIGGQIVSGRTQTETTVRNTVPAGVSTLSLEADISFLRGISPEVWEVSQEEVQAVLLEIEKELAEVGVDLVGLRNKFKNKDKIIGLLESTKDLLKNPTDESIKNFTDNYDTFFATLPQEEIIRVPSKLENLNLVRMYSSVGTEALFEQHGLIKVGDNLYHKVTNTDTTEDLATYVAEQAIANKVSIPTQFLNNVDTTDIASVKIAVEAFASARDTGYGFQNKRMSLYQMAFNHNLQTKDYTQDLDGLAAFKSDEDYLRTSFVEDFYKLQLKEKLENSSLYHNVLSKFAVLDNDIQLVGEFPDTSGLDIARNLTDYFRLTKNNSVKSSFESSNAKADKSFIAVNFPQKISEYSGQFKRAGEYLLTEPTAGVYIKVNGEVYAQVHYGTETNIYSKLETNQDPNFYTTKVKYPYNEAEVFSLADSISIKELAQKSDTGTDKAEKAGFFSAFAKKVRERNNKDTKNIMAPAPAATIFEKNLVEFIRSKGVTVETDINRLQEVLSSFSVNPLMAPEAFDLMRITPQHEGQFENNTFTLHTSERKSKGQVLGIINNYAKRAKENLKNLYGRNYQDSFVMVNTGMWNSASITFRIPKNLRTEAEEVASDQEQTTIEQETARKRERTILWEEIQRGVGRKELEDIGYNFLQTPLGEVLGFEYNGVIYLDESKLNNTTTIHELIHVYQSMIDIKAKQGDLHAQDIVSKRQEVFQEFADQWKAYHQGSQTAQNDANFQIEVSEAVKRNNNLPLNLAPNGKPSLLYKSYRDLGRTDQEAEALVAQVYSDNFINWFGDWINDAENASKVVDENGQPLMVFHGSKEQGKFSVFSEDVERNYNTVDDPDGFYFTSNSQVASSYAQKRRGFMDKSPMERGRVYTAFLNIKNPLSATKQLLSNAKQPKNKRRPYSELKREIYRNFVPEVNDGYINEYNESQNEYIAVFSNQIKSTTENTGAFSTETPDIRLQIIGEKGASNLDQVEEATLRLENLRIAKEMESVGKTPLEIRLATGWEKGGDNLWRYEILDGEINTTFTAKEIADPVLTNKAKEAILGEIYGNKTLYSAYPNLKETKVIFYKEDKRWSDMEGFLFEGKIYIKDDEQNVNKSFEGSQASLQRYLSHEIQHLLQDVEGFARGTIETRIRRELQLIKDKRRDSNETGNQLSEDARIIEEFINSRFEDGASKWFMDENIDLFARWLYRNSYGEVEARNVENRLTFDAKTRLKTLLADTEDIVKENLLFLPDLPKTNFQLGSQIGFDLSSPAYAQRTGETDYAYNQRLLKEVEAFMVAPETAAKLEELRKQNEGVWQKIIEFISELTKYLKTQLGLEDYRGNITGMTRQQYSEALGVSVLKDEYTPNAFFSEYNVATRELQNQIKTENSGLELLIQPSEAMIEKIDGCR